MAELRARAFYGQHTLGVLELDHVDMPLHDFVDQRTSGLIPFAFHLYSIEDAGQALPRSVETTGRLIEPPDVSSTSNDAADSAAGERS